MAEEITALQRFEALLLDNSTPIPKELVDTLAEEYPYFSLPMMLYLSRGCDTDADTRADYESRLALEASDREALRRIVSKKGDRFASFYPDEQGSQPMTTDAAIDTFMKNYGVNDPHEEELLERLIFNPSPDYAQLLAREEERSIPDLSEMNAHASTQDALISAFIVKSKEQEGLIRPSDEAVKEAEPAVVDDAPISAPEKSDDSLLSESLAKIYIKQKRYAKAFEIISGLSLNYPEKSIYFADQLRFLQKLIINQQYNKQQS